MTFGFQGIQPQINPTIIQKNVTVNNGPTGWAGSLFAGMAIGMGLGTGGSIYNPIMPYTPMSGIVPGGCYGPLNPLGLGMGGIASPIANPMAMLNSRMAQPQLAQQTNTQTDSKLANLNTLFNKCKVVPEGNGMYTAVAQDGTMITGTYERVRDGLAEAEAEYAKKKQGADKPQGSQTTSAQQGSQSGRTEA